MKNQLSVQEIERILQEFPALHQEKYIVLVEGLKLGTVGVLGYGKNGIVFDITEQKNIAVKVGKTEENDKNLAEEKSKHEIFLAVLAQEKRNSTGDVASLGKLIWRNFYHLIGYAQKEKSEAPIWLSIPKLAVAKGKYKTFYAMEKINGPSLLIVDIVNLSRIADSTLKELDQRYPMDKPSRIEIKRWRERYLGGIQNEVLLKMSEFELDQNLRQNSINECMRVTAFRRPELRVIQDLFATSQQQAKYEAKYVKTLYYYLEKHLKEEVGIEYTDHHSSNVLVDQENAEAIFQGNFDNLQFYLIDFGEVNIVAK